MRLLLAALVATRAAPRRAQVTLEMMVHFASRGWMKVPGLAPELADVAVEGALDRAFESTLRDYANYSLFYLREKKYIAVESHDHFEACGALSFSDLDAAGGAYRFLDRLQCSVRVERALDPRSALSLPYFQGLNAHRREPRLAAVVEDASLGAFAASLLQSPRVRLYQSALFVKDPAHFNNATGWHRDLQFCPVDVAGGGLVTFWCPYGRPLEGGDATLVFATGSHRDVGFERWYGDAPEAVDAVLARRYPLERVAALGVGDCTAHHGWTWTRAPPQRPDGRARRAFAVSYVTAEATPLPDLAAAGARRGRPAFNPEDELSYEAWLPDLREGAEIDHPLLPVVFGPDAPPRRPEL